MSAPHPESGAASTLATEARSAAPRHGAPWGRISGALAALVVLAIMAFDALPGSVAYGLGFAAIGAAALLPATAALALARRRGRGWGLMAALAGYALLASIALPNYAPADHHGRNPYARACGTTLRMAVEQYATDHEGRYPTRAGWLAAVRQRGGGYLPGEHLPTIWSKTPQGAALAPPPPLVGAAAIAAGARPSPEQTDLGPGRVAEEGPVDARCYGALLYDHDPKTETYVIYAIGKKAGERAVVVFATTNAR